MSEMSADEALRRLDWQIREYAIEQKHWNSQQRYELVTHGHIGPSPERKAMLDKIADSVGSLVVVGSNKSSFNSGFIGHISGVDFNIDFDLTFLDHLPNEFIGTKSQVNINVPNLTEFYVCDGIYGLGNNWKAALKLEKSRRSQRAQTGRIELFETICISPHIEKWDQNGQAVYDFTKPLYGREIWKENSFGTVFERIKHPAVFFGEEAGRWVDLHATNAGEFMQDYYGMQAEPSFV